MFETIVNGLGDDGTRNNSLTSFVGGLLYRNVPDKVAYQLAQLANKNTPDPLPEQEFNRTFTSMLTKDMRRRGGGKTG